MLYGNPIAVWYSFKSFFASKLLKKLALSLGL